MLKKTIKYTDFNNVEKEEEFYFNLTKAELIKLQISERGGLDKVLKDIVAEDDTKQIIVLFEKIIGAAYGEKSEDGKRFMKSDEMWNNFKHTEAYSELFFELLSNADYAAIFINTLIPRELMDQMQSATGDAKADSMAQMQGFNKKQESN